MKIGGENDARYGLVPLSPEAVDDLTPQAVVAMPRYFLKAHMDTQ